MRPRHRGEPEPLASSGKKYARTFYVQYENALGGTLWRYNSHWRWYVKRRRIVRAKHWEWASALAPLWSYHGTKYLHKHGAVGTSMVGRRVQGHLVFSIPGVGAVRHKYPWIDVKVYASGNHWMQWDDG